VAPTDPGPGPVLVARKWVDRRPTVDLLTGEVSTDPRSSGASEADEAALEWGLRLAGVWGVGVLAVTAGPPDAEAVLRPALAAGAGGAVRIDLTSPPGHLAGGAPSSRAVASALALVARTAGSRMVLCGDLSLDRGSGAVPAFLAGELGAAQGLGLVSLAPDPDRPGHLGAWRRLDGGRREELALAPPWVCSVEGGTARLRRAELAGVLAAGRAPVEVVTAETSGPAPPHPARTGPGRPRTHLLTGPDPTADARHRILALTGALVERTPPLTLTLGPGEGADRILEALRAWGELPGEEFP
jgi:electron transfer flavoprotein beta subunit